MREITDRIFAPTIGFVTSFLSWEAWQSIIVSLLVAFAGGFLAHFGRELARKCTGKKSKTDED